MIHHFQEMRNQLSELGALLILLLIAGDEQSDEVDLLYSYAEFYDFLEDCSQEVDGMDVDGDFGISQLL